MTTRAGSFDPDEAYNDLTDVEGDLLDAVERLEGIDDHRYDGKIGVLKEHLGKAQKIATEIIERDDREQAGDVGDEG